MDTLDRTWQGKEPLLGPAIHESKTDTPICTKGSFSPASGFALVNLQWSHTGIEIPYPTLFPLPISFPNPIYVNTKSQNPAPTSNWTEFPLPTPFSKLKSRISLRKKKAKSRIPPNLLRTLKLGPGVKKDGCFRRLIYKRAGDFQSGSWRPYQVDCLRTNTLKDCERWSLVRGTSGSYVQPLPFFITPCNYI